MDFHSRHQETLDGACGRLTIDLSALRANYLALAQRMAPAATAAVVKADAYGLGADRVSAVLYEAGCRDFFVAHFSEAVRLRPRLAHDARIFVLNGLQPGNEGACIDLGIVPVLNSLEQLANWSKAGTSRRQVLPAALQVDTGMSRLGLSTVELERLTADSTLLDGVRLDLVMSHLACADEPDRTANAQQLVVMRRALAQFPDAVMCFANSGGIFLGADYHGSLARPGVALYGGAPSVARPNPMRQVVRLDVAVIQTRMVPEGTAVGYGGMHVTRRETRVATIAAGYADGLPRSLSDRGAVFFGGIRLPILGRVSMDSITIDATDLPEGTLTLGSIVEVIGPNQTLEDIATDAGTISYEILTSLGDRYDRAYILPDTTTPATR